MRTLRPDNTAQDSYIKKQEAIGKDIEPCSAVFQSRFCILRHESALCDLCDIARVSETCVILHNMLVRMSQNNSLVKEGFANEHTPEVVAQFYNATCVVRERSEIFLVRLMD